MTSIVQRSQAGGELTPGEHGRVDLVKYGTGAKTVRNRVVTRHSGTVNRPGTTWVAHARNMSDEIRLIPFKVSKTETYMLLYTNNAFRVIQDGVQVNETTTKVISGATKTDPCKLTIVGHGLTTGDEINVTEVVGMIQLNNRNFKVTVIDVDNVFLQFLNGVDVDATNFTTYSSGGTMAKVFEETTTYPEADLRTLYHSQTAAVMTLTHNNHPVNNLTRISATDWDLEQEEFRPKVDHPSGLSSTVGAGGGRPQGYKVTSIDPEDGEESLPALEALKTVVSVTFSNPVLIQVTAHGWESGQTIELNNFGGGNGGDELNNRRFIFDKVTANTGTLRGEDGAGYTPYVSGGKAGREETVLANADEPSSAAPNVISWTAVEGITRYAVYKEINGEYGFIGTTTNTSFDDTGIEAAADDNPPQYRNPFFGSGNYPAISGFRQQRRGFANTLNDVEKVDFSETGDFKSFRRRNILQDNDAVRFKIEGRELNPVKHLLEVNGKLVVFTESGEWLIKGDANGTLTPIEVNPDQHTYNGSSDLPPIVINSSALYVQNLDSAIRDLNFNFDVDGVDGDDITIHSSHLFEEREIVSWAYQNKPHPVVWAVGDDGVLLGLTYDKNQRMLAWHRHDIDNGKVRDVSVINEGSESVVYLVVEYEMDITGKGNIETVVNVEKMNSFRKVDLVDNKVMDSSITIDGRNTDTGHTMTLTGGTDWDNDEQLTLTSSASFFESGMLADEIHLNGTRDTTDPVTGDTVEVPITIRCEIEQFNTDTEVLVRPDSLVPPSLQATATSDWGHAVTVLNGLAHLEGESVSIFSDGSVVASARNLKNYDEIVVEDGTATIPIPRVVNHVGRPMIADYQTLDIDTVNGTLADKKEIVNNVTIHMRNSRGFWVGPKPPRDDDIDATEGLVEMKIGDMEDSQDAIPLIDGKRDVPILGEYSNGGSIFIRQLDPVPSEILQIVPRGKFAIAGVE